MKVGIPRALSAFYYLPFYWKFIENLGGEAVLSPPTSSATLGRLSLCPTDEPCLSIKLAFPHTAALLQQGVDFVLVPVLTGSEKGAFYCPKHTGLPAMLLNGLPELNENNFLMPQLKWPFRPGKGPASFVEAGRKMGASRAASRAASEKAWSFQLAFEERAARLGLTYPEALQQFLNIKPPVRRKVFNPRARFNPSLRVGVVGHNYVLYDYCSHHLLERLREHARVLVAEMLPQEEMHQSMAGRRYCRELWRFEQKIMGSALYWLDHGLVDCLILVSSFECGPEAIIEVYLEEETRRRGIPFLILTVDEQGGEAGLVTRMEAFLDTVAAAAGKFTVLNSYAASAPPLLTEKRVLGFPTMGRLGSCLAAVLGGSGLATVAPLPITQQTIKLGEELSPEFICYPMTVTIGQMRQCLEAGANTLVMVGGKGRCRLGWYAEMQEMLLRRAGYKFEMITIDSPFPLKRNLLPFLQVAGKLAGGRSWHKLAGEALLAYRQAYYLEQGEERLFYLRARERDRGTADLLYEEFARRAGACASMGSLQAAWREYLAKLKAVPRVETSPLKVRIFGEIYAVFEEFVNRRLARFLGSLEGIRIEVEREITALHWFDLHILRRPRSVARQRQVEKAAAPYLAEHVGGHGRESVGLAALARREGIDGLVHLWPFTCMPEIIAQNILTRVAGELQLPLLTVIVNEQTGEAGLQTRLESFAYILQERRDEREALTI